VILSASQSRVAAEIATAALKLSHRPVGSPAGAGTGKKTWRGLRILMVFLVEPIEVGDLVLSVGDTQRRS
jgi:hypothetical protein